MDAKGSALATVFGQLLGCVLLGHLFNRHFNKEVALSIQKIRPHWQTMKDIYRIAIPSTVLQAVGAVMNFSINNTLCRIPLILSGNYVRVQFFR